MGFFKKVFSVFRREETPPPLTPFNAAPPVTAPAPAPAVRARRVAISWQEILDPDARIAAYLMQPASLIEGARPSGEALLDALHGEGIERLGERRKVLAPLTAAQWQEADFSRLFGANVFFYVSPDNARESQETLTTLAASIRQKGGKVAVDAMLIPPSGAGAVTADMLVLSLAGVSLPLFEQRLAALRQQYPGLPLLVKEVGSWSEYRFLLSLGVNFCSGAFTSSPDINEQVEGISQSRLVVLEMLNMLRQDADIADVAAEAKRDPGVVLKLIEMANSPLSGLSRKVVALEDAILLLGRDALYRWLALAMFRLDARGNRDESLMVIAISRAAFLESLAPENNRQLAGELFLVGLFSMIESLLQIPLAKILERLSLPVSVSDVLLRSEGPYARYLMLALAMERCRVEQALALAQQLGIDSGLMLENYSQSMAWATSDLLS